MEGVFNSLGRFLKETFGERVHRMNVNIPGATDSREGDSRYALCPGGILAIPPQPDLPGVEKQINNAKGRIRERFKIGRYIVHFHTPRDTYIDLETLDRHVRATLEDDEITGINLTIRLDCLDKEMMDYLAKLNQYVYLWVETGVHSLHDATLEKMGMPFTAKEAVDMLLRLSGRMLRVSPHIVMGLPGETEEMMDETVRRMAMMMISGINIHNFYVTEGSAWEGAYRSGELPIMEMDDYVNKVCDLIEQLPPGVVLRRIVGEPPGESLLAPDWCRDKRAVISAITTELKNRSSSQGSRNYHYAYLLETATTDDTDAEELQAEVEDDAVQEEEAATAPAEEKE